MNEDNPQNIDSDSFLWICWILYILSLMLPAGYYDGYFNDFSVLGFEYFLFGIIGVIDHSGDITWLANPIFMLAGWLAFFLKKKV